jgi:hypothetical protein
VSSVLSEKELTLIRSTTKAGKAKEKWYEWHMSDMSDIMKLKHFKTIALCDLEQRNKISL